MAGGEVKIPYTVASSFETFRANIEPPGYDRETATNRKEHLVGLLKDTFTIVDAFASGSLPKYTAVKDHADLDIIVVLHYGKHIEGKQPSEVLQAVRDCLGAYRTNVRKNGQAVTLYYKTWPNVDIVPVSRVVNSDGTVNYYSIPDANTESWIPSRPVKHANDLATRNNEFGVEFKRIIKMIKWWNHQHSQYLQSYHIEVLALKHLTGKFSSYPWEIYTYFKEAASVTAYSLWHELGHADAYLTATARNEAIKRLETAREKAHDAWYKTTGTNDDHKGAIAIWRQIFGDEFPSYG